MAQLSPKIFLVVETTEYEGDPFLSLLIRMINKVIGSSCIRFRIESNPRIQFLPDGSLFVLIITNKVVINK